MQVPQRPNWWARIQLGARTGDVPYQLVTSWNELLAWRLFLVVLSIGGAGYAAYDVARQDWRAAVGGVVLGIVAHLFFRWRGTRDWAWVGGDYLLIPAKRPPKIPFSSLLAVRPREQAIAVVYTKRGFGWGIIPWARGSDQETTVRLVDPVAFVGDLKSRIENRYGADRWEELRGAMSK